MRKGQAKLIEKAEGFLPKEFVEKLMDESLTLKQLEKLYYWLCMFTDCPEIFDDWETFCQDVFSFSWACTVKNDWRRTHELCIYVKERFHGCEHYAIDNYWQEFAHRIYSAKKDGQYLFNKDDMTRILDYVRDNVLYKDYFDYKPSEGFLKISDEFSSYIELMHKFANVNIGIMIAVALSEDDTCSGSMDEFLRIVRLASQMAGGNLEMRARCYIKAGITDEEWIQYEQMIENKAVNEDVVTAEIAFKHYPGFKDFIDSLMEKDSASLPFDDNKLADGYSRGCINFTNTEIVKPIFDACTKFDCDEFGGENIVSVNTPVVAFSWKITFSGVFLTFKKYERTAICDTYSWEEPPVPPVYSCRYGGRLKFARTYLLTNDYSILMTLSSGKWIPAGLHSIDRDAQKGCTLVRIVLSWFFQCIADMKGDVWKDIAAYSARDYGLLPALTCNEITAGHTLDEVMNTHYKNAGFIDWNRCDLRLGNLIMQALPLVDEKSGNFLLANKYMSFEKFTEVYCARANKIHDPAAERNNPRHFVVKKFLSEIIQKRVNGNIDITIQDYIDMSEKLHRKISLMFTSKKKVTKAHNDLARELTAKNTPRVKVPKNSKFNHLAELLPDSMEWIKSKQRLVQEGSEMHNCVASYADLINNDSCAIYSFVYNDKRYTIEFASHRNKYFIRQLYGVCNSEPEEGVEDYVKGFLVG